MKIGEKGSTIKLSLIAVDEHRGYSKNEVWAFYRLASTPYEFLTSEARENIAYGINNALAALITNSSKSIECQLFVTSAPLNVEEWADEWRHNIHGNAPTAAFHHYVDDMKDFLHAANYSLKEVYLGVLLGKRGSDGDSDEGILGQIKEMASSLTGMIDKSLGNSDSSISDRELSAWKKKGAEIDRILTNGHLGAEKVDAYDIVTLLKRSLYPAMPLPKIHGRSTQNWGKGELASLGTSDIYNHRKFLRIIQTDEAGYDMEGYRATLAFASFPDTMYFPENEPWMHYASLLNLPFDMYSRFTLEPNQKVKKAVERKIAEIKDERSNAHSAGEMPLDIQERLESATMLEYELSRDSMPWVYARHRIVITAPTEEELRDRVQRTIGHYADLNIRVQWTTGDQLNLLLESQPVDRVRLQSYLQKQSINIISGGMPTANSAVGDRRSNGKGWVGPYIGETTSRICEPVFFSPHVLVARDAPGGVLILGSPGGGKSFLGFTLAIQSFAQRITTIFLDPKGDAIPLTKIKDFGEVNLVDLRNGEDGLLDPFALSENPAEQIILALEAVRMLNGNISNAQLPLLSVVLQSVVKQPDPSLDKVVDVLMAHENPDAQALGATLDLMRNVNYARLCFSSLGNKKLDMRNGLNIITLVGLEIPSTDTLVEDYTVANRLAVTVMYLLVSYMRILLLDMDKKSSIYGKQKMLLIDEAWMVSRTSYGRKIIEEVARMGRSLNTTLVLISQNARDFKQEGILNSISTTFAFRTKSKTETEEVIEVLDVENNASNRQYFMSLNNGECIMKDLDGRLSSVQIVAWNESWKRDFDTNPLTKGKKTS